MDLPDGRREFDASSLDPVIEKYLQEPQPRLFEPLTVIVTLIVSGLGSIIGLELIVRLGITANTSIIGALIAVLVSIIPARTFSGFKNIYRQNLIQTSISAATFGAGNALLLAMGTIWLMGYKESLMPMLFGAAFGMLVDITMMYWMFDTPAFPADEAWPPGIATSETILAAAEGGKRALLLIIGGIVGAVGQAFKIPMDVVGVAWIGNEWTLTMFGIGLLIRGYSKLLFGIDINALYIPHGIMIGAGIVALAQIMLIIRGKRLTQKVKEKAGYVTTRTPAHMLKSLKNGFILYLIGGLILAFVGGILSDMSLPMLIWWIVFAAISALVSELMVGISAMHAGWFPGFATALIFLVLGMLMGFPPLALGLLVGYTACTGPAFADMGYDLKTGWLLRGEARDVNIELFGRRQQYFAELMGGLVAIVVVIFSYTSYFSQDLFPPVDRVFAATIQAGAQPGVLQNLLIWAVVGAVIQFIGGAERQIGILFATGLLILNPNAGFGVLVAIVVRVILQRKYGNKVQSPMYILAAGFIAGSTLYSFFTSTLNLFTKRSSK
ncbi:OPT/YSL family transporter [Calorimonas adulescens]|uniref:OPT family oligopeptide transporter n=1 Tax=Calorimonas adulescens TaxID=2606906 RepID=A0A5D8QDP4_9THEO|nr:OPT/YSL family transporter [Calorimonas adulescens]TZE82294.1 OPT family oligopeptide transporter [Calorimonas adulescens]